jgi:SAM-dependent methyltransferase
MNKELSKEQTIQEEGYEFPYHFLTHFKKGVFQQSRVLEWGFEYQTYIDFLVALVSKKTFQTLLDVGCGEGRFIYELQRVLGSKKLIGTDYSSRAIDLARALNPKGVFIAGDITDKLLFKEQFDIVTLIETLEHIDPKELDIFIRSIASRVKPGGYFIITVPSTMVPVNAKHYQHFTLKKLEETVAPYFDIKEHFYLNRVGMSEYLIRRTLSNRFFYLNEKHLLRWIYAYYKQNMLYGDASSTRRICIVCIKKNHSKA